MKTKLFALVAILIFAAMSFGQASNAKEREVKNLKSYLNKVIDFPEFALDKKMEGSVTLIVKVDENRKLKVTGIQGSCCEFEDYVKKWFQKLEEKPVVFSEEIGMKKVVINFKLI